MNGEPSDTGDDFDYDSETGAYTMTFDGLPSRAVIELMAEVLGDAVTLEPLYDVLDPDALDRMVTHRPTGPRGGDLSITFRYHDYEVTVHRFGVIRARPATEDVPNHEPVNG